MADAIEAVGLIRIHPASGAAVAALRGLDVTIGEHEFAAIVGPSGSGKSSLLRLLAGLDRPTAGRLRVLGLDLHGAFEADLARHRRDRVGIVEQHYRRSLTPYLPVAEIVAMPLALRGVSRRQRDARAGELLDRVGLGDRRTALRDELSGGEQQRVAVALALVARPRLLLADEPTGELDRATAGELLELLREITRAERVTTVIVTHDDLVEAVADRVVHVRDGRAVAERRAGRVRRLVDFSGWLAPELPPGPQPVARLDRAASAEPALVLEGAARSFGPSVAVAEGAGTAGRRRVRRLGLPPMSATFDCGGFHVVTGPSGTGKTTLLRLAVGLDRPTSGRVITLGRDLAMLDREALATFRAVHIGLVDQIRDLVPFLSARENVELGLAIRSRSNGDSAGAALEALDLLGVAHHADRRPDGLSAGERLRVALARAIAPRPALLMLDEPTAALDRAGAAAVARLLADLAGSSLTVVATTHDPALIEAASARLDLVEAGQAVINPATAG